MIDKDKLDDLTEKVRKSLENITPEELEKYFPKDKTPKGWVSIEDHLPKMLAVDICQGYTEYKVKLEFGEEAYSKVSDHSTWYYYAKEQGITHWWND